MSINLAEPSAVAPADGGRNPKWNEVFYFPLNGREERLVVEVKDHQTPAKPLGVASILLDKVGWAAGGAAPQVAAGQGGMHH